MPCAVMEKPRSAGESPRAWDLQQKGAAYVGGLVREGVLKEGSAEHAALHAMVAAGGAMASGGDVVSGAAGAAASSLMTRLFDPKETISEKESQINLMTTLVAGMAGVLDQDAGAATGAAHASLDNNYATQLPGIFIDIACKLLPKINKGEAKPTSESPSEQRESEAAPTEDKPVEQSLLNKVKDKVKDTVKTIGQTDWLGWGFNDTKKIDPNGPILIDLESRTITPTYFQTFDEAKVNFGDACQSLGTSLGGANGPAPLWSRAVRPGPQAPSGPAPTAQMVKGIGNSNASNASAVGHGTGPLGICRAAAHRF